MERAVRFGAVNLVPLVVAIVLVAAPLFGADGLDAAERQKLESFSRELAQAVSSANSEFLSGHVDVEVFCARVTDGIEIDPEQKREFSDGIALGLKSGALLRAAMGQPYHFLRLHEFEGEERPVFRLMAEGGGMDYHVLSAQVTESRGVLIEDVYDFATGEWMSASVRRMALPAIAQTNRSLLDKIFSTTETAYIEHFETVIEMERQLSAGAPDETIALFDTLPQILQDQKPVYVTYLSALAGIEARVEQYKASMLRFARLYPGDSAARLMLIDYHMLNGNWTGMFESLDWLETRVGGDPYTDVMRAAGMILKEDWKAAEKYARRAIELEYTLEDAHWSLTTIGLSTNNHELTATELAALRDDFGYAINRAAMSVEPMYSAFLDSPQAARLFGEAAAE